MRFIFTCFVVLGFISKAWSQTTYTSNPSVGNYTACPAGNVLNTCPSGTFLGNTIKFQLEQVTGTHFIFKLIKCDAEPFSSGGWAYIKEDNVCGVVVDSESFSSGVDEIFLSVDIPDDFTNGTIEYKATLNSNTGDKFWGGTITISAETDPRLIFENCLDLNNNFFYFEGDEISAIYSVKNIGSTSWDGKLVTSLVNASADETQNIHVIENLHIGPGQEYTVSTTSTTIDVSTGSAALLVSYDNASINGGSAFVEAGDCSPVDEWGNNSQYLFVTRLRSKT